MVAVALRRALLLALPQTLLGGSHEFQERLPPDATTNHGQGLHRYGHHMMVRKARSVCFGIVLLGFTVNACMQDVGDVGASPESTSILDSTTTSSPPNATQAVEGSSTSQPENADFSYEEYAGSEAPDVRLLVDEPAPVELVEGGFGVVVGQLPESSKYGAVFGCQDPDRGYLVVVVSVPDTSPETIATALVEYEGHQGCVPTFPPAPTDCLDRPDDPPACSEG